MSRPDYALILPIADLDLGRDQGRKLRLAGFITSIDPASSLCVLSDEGSSLLVDLSLCTQPHDEYDQSDPGGWRHYRAQQQQKDPAQTGIDIVPPQLKSKCMVIGYLVRQQDPVDIAFVQSGRARLSDSGEVQTPSSSSVEQELPNRFFVLEAILARELDPSYDLSLWNRTARLRSLYEYNQPSIPMASTAANKSETANKDKDKGKGKGKEKEVHD
ncbi:hypothetical protein BCV70DRAFT_84643 [Testicularia cyperi]|uniref:Uncharacterized protein n=1 Tax=Testicularia cyperi TaxID=1882483 RepID=A0A317XT22_9BASI|nr:hypothetical protein BCV70DRAFT_84643 [Testicularia cyperi]